MSLRVAVLGASGRMGQALINAINDDDRFLLVGALVRSGSDAVGQAAGIEAAYTDQPVSALDDAEVAIDFTLPAAFHSNLTACLEAKCPIVIGTTGLSDAHMTRLREVGRELPVVWSPNMSVGVNLCFRLAQLAGAALHADYDVEIIDEHHRYKRDAPSGTAIRLGELIAASRGQGFDEVKEFRAAGKDRQRHRGAIGFSSVRAGAEAGKHTVMFSSENETVEIRHQARDRGAFATGALLAADWLRTRSNGLYSMGDVLGL